MIDVKGKGPMQVYFLLGRSRHGKVTRGTVSHRPTNREVEII